MFSGGGSRVSNHLRQLRDHDLHRRHQPQLGFGFVFGFGLGTRIAGLRVRRSLKSLSARRISSFRSIIHSKSPPDIPTLSHCFSQREDECELPSDVLSSVAVPWRRTNFGRTAGGPFIITSYNYHAPIDEYGLIRQPKYGHLMELHKAVKLCEKALLNADLTVTSLGRYQQSHVFSSKPGGCAAFLSNYNANSAATVTFNDRNYELPAWSISILPDCENVVFNTAKVGVQTSQK